jgi:hypothetical protein
MNNHAESNHLSNIDTNISSINSNITNIYSTLNIISNTILINQRQTLLNELRTPPPRTNLFSHMSPLFTTPSPPIFRSTFTPNTTSTTATQIPSTTSTSTQIPSTTSTQTTSTNTTNTGSTRSRDSLNTFLSSLLRNEIPSGYGIGNMEISLMGLNPQNEEENLVISHHNIFNNTKIKLYSTENNNEIEEEGNVEEIPKCSICLENIENNQIIREITKCKHIFHVNCADKWFEDHIKCPNCRQDIRIEIVS